MPLTSTCNEKTPSSNTVLLIISVVTVIKYQLLKAKKRTWLGCKSTFYCRWLGSGSPESRIGRDKLFTQIARLSKIKNLVARQGPLGGHHEINSKDSLKSVLDNCRAFHRSLEVLSLNFKDENRIRAHFFKSTSNSYYEKINSCKHGIWPKTTSLLFFVLNAFSLRKRLDPLKACSDERSLVNTIYYILLTGTSEGKRSSLLPRAIFKWINTACLTRFVGSLVNCTLTTHIIIDPWLKWKHC